MLGAGGKSSFAFLQSVTVTTVLCPQAAFQDTDAALSPDYSDAQVKLLQRFQRVYRNLPRESELHVAAAQIPLDACSYSAMP